MGIFSCWHRWGFPRRWPEFDGDRNVDVQTCLKCGARRESRVRFGPVADTPETLPEQRVAEVLA